MRLSHSLRPALLLLAINLALNVNQAQAFLGLFRKADPVAPTANQRSADEAEASAMLQEAREAQNGGSGGKAKSLYRQICKKYPFSQSASEASYSLALLLKDSGAALATSFDAFQTFVEKYRNSARFDDAIRQQFEIAESAKGGKRERSLILLKFKLGTDAVAEMFEKIIKNAPFGKLAPLAQFNIGELYQDAGEKEKAVDAFQLVVENYPRSKQADEAQFRIGNINSVAANRSEDKSNLLAARDALTTYVEVNPKGERSEEARQGLAKINSAEAKQSLDVAKFYIRIGKGKAAAIYLNEALRFGSTEVSDEARELLSTLAVSDPESITSVRKQQPQQDYTSDSAKSLKDSDDYVGPTLPELKEATKAPAMRSGLDKFLPLPGTDEEPAAPKTPPGPTPKGSVLPGLPAAGAGSPPPPVPPKPKAD